MTIPDLRGCPICHRSIRGDLAECPYCHAPLEPRVTLRVRFGTVVVEVEELVDE